MPGAEVEVRPRRRGLQRAPRRRRARDRREGRGRPLRPARRLRPSGPARADFRVHVRIAIRTIPDALRDAVCEPEVATSLRSLMCRTRRAPCERGRATARESRPIREKGDRHDHFPGTDSAPTRAAPAHPREPGRARRSPYVAVGIVLAVRGNGIGTTSSTGLTGSGVAATQTRTLPAFTAVDLAGANNVTVHVGGTQAVTVHGDDNLVKYVTTTVQDGTLAIGQSRSFSTKSPMSVEITVPALDAVTLSGAGVLYVDGVTADHFSVRAPGSGVLSVTGTTTTLDATLSGSGDVRLDDARSTRRDSDRLRLRPPPGQREPQPRRHRLGRRRDLLHRQPDRAHEERHRHRSNHRGVAAPDIGRNAPGRARDAAARSASAVQQLPRRSRGRRGRSGRTPRSSRRSATRRSARRPSSASWLVRIEVTRGLRSVPARPGSRATRGQSCRRRAGRRPAARDGTHAAPRSDRRGRRRPPTSQRAVNVSSANGRLSSLVRAPPPPRRCALGCERDHAPRCGRSPSHVSRSRRIAARRSKCSRTSSSIRLTAISSVPKHSTSIEIGCATPIA